MSQIADQNLAESYDDNDENFGNSYGQVDENPYQQDPMQNLNNGPTKITPGTTRKGNLMNTTEYLKSKNQSLFKRTDQISTRFSKLKSDALKKRSQFVAEEEIFQDELMDRQDDMDDMCDDLMRSIKKAEIVNSDKLKEAFHITPQLSSY